MSFADAGPIDPEHPRRRACARCGHWAVHHETNYGWGGCWWQARCRCTQFDPAPLALPETGMFAASELERFRGQAAFCDACEAWYAPVAAADGACSTQRCTGGCGAELALEQVQ